MKKMKDKLIRFMRERYGYDELSQFLLIVSVICTLLSNISGLWFLRILGTGSLILVLMRGLSKNFYQCRLQNQKYLGVKNKVVKKLTRITRSFKQKKDFRFFQCPSCHQKIRVPKGKGKITITCPKCGTNFPKVS